MPTSTNRHAHPRRRSGRSVCVVAVLAVAALFAPMIGMATPAHAQSQGPDTAELTNSFISDGGSETVFDGPVTASVSSDTEFVGFGGFDIDVDTGDGGGVVEFRWSDDPQFDDFEGAFDATFTDIFTLSFDDYEVTSATAGNANGLAPQVQISDGEIRVIFGIGSAYQDGHGVDVTFAGQSTTPVVTVNQPELTTGSPTPTVEAVASTADTPAPRAMFEAPDITLPAGAAPTAPEEPAPASDRSDGGSLAATGRASTQVSSLGLVLLASGGVSLVTSRRVRR